MDDIYGAPLGEFIATRDALAARLKAAGDKSGAAAAKGLRKPSVVAWAANQVVWHASAEWQRLEAAARGLRRAHEHAATAEELRAASREQREALLACESRAAERLKHDGHAVGAGLLQKVGGTLLALAYGVPGAIPGRLEQELQPPGFEVMAGVALASAPTVRPLPQDGSQGPTAASSSAPPGPSLAPGPSDEERTRRRTAPARAESRAAFSRRALEAARARLAERDERRLELERELDAARLGCEDARRQLESAEAQQASAEAALREEREADHSGR